jgi:hypothetical protein
MYGKISTYIIIPLFCIMVIICAGAFYTGNSQVSIGNPNPAYPTTQVYIGNNFFTSITGFVNAVSELGNAVQRMSPTNPSWDIGGMAVATVDAGIAIIKVLIGIPVLIASFIYDIVRLVLFFLPTVAPPELMLVISIAVLIPIIAILMELASAIRPPGLAKW